MKSLKRGEQGAVNYCARLLNSHRRRDTFIVVVARMWVWTKYKGRGTSRDAEGIEGETPKASKVVTGCPPPQEFLKLYS